MIIFDFDKTLISYDSLFGYYSLVERLSPNHNRFYFICKRVILLFTAILYKVKIINNTRLKKVGVTLFLKNKSHSYLQEIGRQYAQTFKFNSVYYDVFLKTNPNKRLICTASFEDYVQYIFPGEKIIASKLNYNHNKVKKLELNCYGFAKVKAIKEQSIHQVEVLYTDSFSDKPLMTISKKVYLVDGNQIKLIKT